MTTIDRNLGTRARLARRLVALAFLASFLIGACGSEAPSPADDTGSKSGSGSESSTKSDSGSSSRSDYDY